MLLKELLAKKDYLPITVMNDGEAATREHWEQRRKEMLVLPEDYSYGKTPDMPVQVKGKHRD